MSVSGPTSDHRIIQSWAKSNSFVPAEKLPAYRDGEPAGLQLVSAAGAASREDVRTIPWADFFARFDQHGLAFVFDDDSPGYNEILQIEARSPYRRPEQG